MSKTDDSSHETILTWNRRDLYYHEFVARLKSGEIVMVHGFAAEADDPSMKSRTLIYKRTGIARETYEWLGMVRTWKQWAMYLECPLDQLVIWAAKKPLCEILDSNRHLPRLQKVLESAQGRKDQ